MTDSYGNVRCAKAGGGVMRDQYGNLLCGIGYCAADETGRVMCSTERGGGAARESNGSVKCAGGCREGVAQLCEVPR